MTVAEIGTNGTLTPLSWDIMRARYRETLRSQKLVTTTVPLRYAALPRCQTAECAVRARRRCGKRRHCPLMPGFIIRVVHTASPVLAWALFGAMCKAEAAPPVLPAAAPRSDVPVSRATADLYRGRYEFAPGAIAEVRPAGAGWEIEVAGRASLYLPADKWVSLTPVGKDEFELLTPGADRLRFDRDSTARIVGLTINPGPWPIRARRL